MEEDEEEEIEEEEEEEEVEGESEEEEEESEEEEEEAPQGTRVWALNVFCLSVEYGTCLPRGDASGRVFILRPLGALVTNMKENVRV